VATAFSIGDWALGCHCGKCGRRTPILKDGPRSGAAAAPIAGEFHFACAHCGKDNVANAGDLERFQIRSQKPETRNPKVRGRFAPESF
jgi:hypothetical protein